MDGGNFNGGCSGCCWLCAEKVEKMGIPTINKTVRTLGAGESVPVPSGGAEINLWKIEGASEIEISMNNSEFLPVTQGRGFVFEHSNFIMRNNNLVPVNVTILQSTEPGSFIDNQDVATSVSIGGSFAVVNSDLVEDGGTMRKLGTSFYHLQHDHTVAATQLYNVITEAVNVNGILVKSAAFKVFAASVADPAYLHQRSNGGSALQGILLISSSAGDAWLQDQWRLAPGQRLSIQVPTGNNIVANISYDIL
jgi:hypothetical protein